MKNQKQEQVMIRDIREIRIDEIDLDTSQPRQIIEHNKMQELADDMEEAGQIVPVILTPYYKRGDKLVIGKDAENNKNARWFVLDGYRRILAARDFLGWEKIDAEIRIELSELDVYETQFRVGSKRVQISVTEMAKAIERFSKTWKTAGKKDNYIKRLSQLTGFSTSYFDMANDIVTEPNKKLKKLIMDKKEGPYVASEIKSATKNKDIRDGMKEAVIEHVKKTGKSSGALFPRHIKPILKKLDEDITKNSKQKKEIAKNKTLEYFNRSLEKEDIKPQFETYLFDIQLLYRKIVNQWNVKRLTNSQKNELVENLTKIIIYLKK